MTTQIEIFSHFGINQTNEIVKSDTYSRVEEVLDSTIRDHGWVAFAGQIGSGKTVTVFEALKSLRRDTSVHFVELISPDRKAINESSIVYTLMMHLGERFLGDTSMPRSNAARMIKVDRLLAKIKKEGRRVCLVIDEAHNVCPQDPDDSHLALSTEHLIAIAGEGRKYGIYLMLATQRPEKIHKNVLSQCDNLVLMRINSRSDIDELTRAFSAVPPALIQRSDRFGLGEGLAYGRIAPNALLFETGKRITPDGGQDVPTSWIEGISASQPLA